MAKRFLKAFSLAEVLLAMGTIVLVILTIQALVIALNRGSRKGIDLSAAHLVADQVLSLTIERAQKNLPAGEHSRFWDTDYAAPGVAYLAGNTRVNRTDFFYRIDAATVRDAAGNPLNNSLPFNRLKLVQIELYWWNPTAQSTRAGYGRLSLQTSRLVHEKRF